MNLKGIHIFLITSLLLLCNEWAMAQVVIPDPNFRQFLVSNYPSYMNPDQTLNPTAAATYSGQFKCYSQNVTDLTGVEYFTGATSLEVKYNPGLQSIPNIDGLTNITILGLDSNGLTSLPNLSALTQLQILSFHHNQVTTIPSLNGLTQIVTLFVHNNNLTSIPDLSSLINLNQFIFSNNPIKSLPSFSSLAKLTQFIGDNTLITSLPDLSACPLLSSILVRKHLLTYLPDLSNNSNLSELLVNNGLLSTLPDLSGLSLLTSLNIANNNLSFEDILPLTSNTAFSSFIISPQTPGNSTTINALTSTSPNIALNFDNAVLNSVYTWYKDSIFLTTTSTNTLTLNSVTSLNAGIYTCTITNTTAALSGIVLNAKPITLKIIPCVSSNNISYHILNTDCSYPIQVMVDDSSFVTGTPPFMYRAKNKTDSSNFSTSNIVLPKEGVYDLIVKDAMGCVQVFNSTLLIPRNESCDPVFYPNGDGIADTYFIQETGYAKIYNKNGEIVNEMNTPASWDGTNKNGQDAPIGLYVIVVNDSINIKVTILR
jgi:internalin A